MKIRKLHLKNIGVFDDQEIVFQPCSAKDKAEIHIFTGQNGSGKSTLLMFLAALFNTEGVSDKNIMPGFKRISPTLRYINIDKNNLKKRLRGNSETQIGFEVVHKNEIKNHVFKIALRDYVSSIFGSPFDDNNIDNLLTFYSEILKDYELYDLDFAVFSYSGYRVVKAEKIELLKEYRENPLADSLNFVKNYGEFSINQWIANNISKNAIEEKKRNKESAQKFATNLKNLEDIISSIIGYRIEFDIEIEPISIIVKSNNQRLDFDVLPDGLRSLISWIGDLLMRLDLLYWSNDLPIFEQEMILFLDEIEVHLHPAWQRKVLPVVQKLFKNSQIFISTHSPFVINSVDDAWVYKLKLENGKARVADVVLSEDGLSYQTVLREIFGIDKRFGGEAQNKLDDFYRQRDSLLKANGKGKLKKKDFLKLAKDLASQSAELQSLVFLELARLSKETGEPYEI